MLEKYPKNTSLVQWSFYFLSLLIAHYSKWIPYLLQKNICKVISPIFDEQEYSILLFIYFCIVINRLLLDME